MVDWIEVLLIAFQTSWQWRPSCFSPNYSDIAVFLTRREIVSFQVWSSTYLVLNQPVDISLFFIIPFRRKGQFKLHYIVNLLHQSGTVIQILTWSERSNFTVYLKFWSWYGTSNLTGWSRSTWPSERLPVKPGCVVFQTEFKIHHLWSLT